MPKVSVCIPVYNVEAYIERCARSLFEQTLEEMEFIFVDDCSTDRSVEILKSLLPSYPKRREKVIIFQHQKNLGVAKTRNDAISLANGEFVIHCDADDYIDSIMMETLYSEAKSRNVDLVYCDFSKIDENGTETHISLPDISNSSEYIKKIFMGDIHASLWNKLISRTIIIKTPLDCPSDICMCEDMRILVQYLTKIQTISHIAIPYYKYSYNTKSLTSNTYFSVKAIKSRMSNLIFFDSIFTNNEFVDERRYMKQRLLLEALLHGGISNTEWHSIWKKEKRLFWKCERFSYLLKFYFYLGCVSIPLVRMIKKIH